MRKAQMFLAVLLLICVTLVSANAEILTIDLDNASYEEIDNAYQQLRIPLIIVPNPATSSPPTRISRKSAIQAHCLHAK